MKCAKKMIASSKAETTLAELMSDMGSGMVVGCWWSA